MLKSEEKKYIDRTIGPIIKETIKESIEIDVVNDYLSYDSNPHIRLNFVPPYHHLHNDIDTPEVDNNYRISIVIEVPEDDRSIRDSRINQNNINTYAFMDAAERLLLEFFQELTIWKRIAKQDLSLKEILSLKNIEHRRHALKCFGIERLLDETEAKKIDESEKGNVLYKMNNKEIFDSVAYFLKYKDPSTERTYFSGIPPHLFEGKPKEEISADEAMAWKFQWTLEEYYNIKKET